MEQGRANPRVREALENELRETVGDEAVERADLDIDRAVGQRQPRVKAEANRSRLIIAVVAAVGIAVIVAIAAALQSWWILIPLLTLHAIGTFVVVRTTFRASTSVEKPAPTTQAMLEDEGVADPEGALNDLVDQATGRDEESRARRTLSDSSKKSGRTDEPAEDVARQQESWTPDSRTRDSRSL
jgi:hypothetical protein